MINKTILLLMILSLVSCSTIFNGSISDVDVQSSPSKCKIFVNGVEIGETPAILKLQRGETHLIELKYPGYETYQIRTSKELTGWFWGNLVCGGLIGMAVDLITGNAYDVEPAFLNVTLNAKTSCNEAIQLENYSGIYVAGNDGKVLDEIKIVWE